MIHAHFLTERNTNSEAQIKGSYTVDIRRMIKNIQQRSGNTNHMYFDTDDARQYILGSTSKNIFEETKVRLSPRHQPKFELDINNANNRAQTTMLLKTGDLSGLRPKRLRAFAAEDYSNQEQQKIASMKPPMIGEYLIQPQEELVGHSNSSYLRSDPHDVGLVSSYCPQFSEQYNEGGIHRPKRALPLEMMEEPVYVNPKQYRGILRRRQSRAKAELENKPIKSRKPYIHESRHLHAMRRARGSGGRFLNTKKLENTPSSAISSKRTNYLPSSTINGDNLSRFSSNNSKSIFGKEVWDKESIQKYNIDVNSHYNPYQQRSENSTFYSFLHQKVVEGEGDMSWSWKQNQTPNKAVTSQYLV